MGSDEMTFTGWRKPRRSFCNGNCTEVAAGDGLVAVRDTKQDGAGPVLAFPAAAWAAFTAGIRRP